MDNLTYHVPIIGTVRGVWEAGHAACDAWDEGHYGEVAWHAGTAALQVTSFKADVKLGLAKGKKVRQRGKVRANQKRTAEQQGKRQGAVKQKQLEVARGTVELEHGTGPKIAKTNDVKAKPGAAFPNRVLPRSKNGVPIPDGNFPHTQLGVKGSRSGGSYPQAREFDANGSLVRDIDFTDHGRPQSHTNPHQHRYTENTTGGTKVRSGPEPLS